MDNIKGFLGIAKKAGKLEIGEECVENAAYLSRARLIMSASDASDGSRRRAEYIAESCGTVSIVLPYSKAELGALVGRGSPGMLAISDTNLAANLVSRLAEVQPDIYGGMAEIMQMKLKRMNERRQARPKDGKRSTGKRRTRK